MGFKRTAQNKVNANSNVSLNKKLNSKLQASILHQRTKAELPSDVSSEIEQWKTRYNYVLSEKAILSRQLSDMEQEVRS